jgi:hypothetical protein
MPMRTGSSIVFYDVQSSARRSARGAGGSLHLRLRCLGISPHSPGILPSWLIDGVWTALRIRYRVTLPLRTAERRVGQELRAVEKKQGGLRDLALPQEEGKIPKLHELGITYNHPRPPNADLGR